MKGNPLKLRKLILAGGIAVGLILGAAPAALATPKPPKHEDPCPGQHVPVYNEKSNEQLPHFVCGPIQGPQGEPGLPGIEGPAGPAGPQGPAGENGADGVNGADGKNGSNGADGKNGVDGAAGKDADPSILTELNNRLFILEHTDPDAPAAPEAPAAPPLTGELPKTGAGTTLAWTAALLVALGALMFGLRRAMANR